MNTLSTEERAERAAAKTELKGMLWSFRKRDRVTIPVVAGGLALFLVGARAASVAIWGVPSGGGFTFPDPWECVLAAGILVPLVIRFMRRPSMSGSPLQRAMMTVAPLSFIAIGAGIHTGSPAKIAYNVALALGAAGAAIAVASREQLAEPDDPSGEALS